ncbi:MAG TPA: hypothetical protein VIH38_07310 [Steroidobacteraceae bacterium]
MNETTGGRRRWCRARPRRAGVLAVTAGLVLLTAACGGSPSSSGSPSSTGTGGASSSFVSHELAFARCVRAHGVPNFPDPATDPDGSPVFNLQHAGIDTQSPQVKAEALGCMSRLHLAKLPNYRV